MNHSQIAHAWANQTKPAAATSSFYFEGTTIYSYGNHFPIATITPSGTILFTSRTYSNSTSKHINHASRAIPHGVPVIYCKHVTDLDRYPANNAENLEAYTAELESSLKEYTKARKWKDSQGERLDAQLANVHAYLAHFKTKKKDIPAPLKAILKTLESGAWKEAPEARTARLARLAELESTSDQRKAAARAARLAQEAEENADKLARWMKGEDVRFFQSGGLASLRVKNGRVETSQGASVSIPAALRLFHHVTEQQTAPLEVDGFTFRRLEDGVATIGCHRIEFSEMERIAPQCEALSA